METRQASESNPDRRSKAHRTRSIASSSALSCHSRKTLIDPRKQVFNGGRLVEHREQLASSDQALSRDSFPAVSLSFHLKPVPKAPQNAIMPAEYAAIIRYLAGLVTS